MFCSDVSCTPLFKRFLTQIQWTTEDAVYQCDIYTIKKFLKLICFRVVVFSFCHFYISCLPALRFVFWTYNPSCIEMFLHTNKHLNNQHYKWPKCTKNIDLARGKKIKNKKGHILKSEETPESSISHML